MEAVAPLAGKAATVPCYHCGIKCPDGAIAAAEKSFCCEGCLLVFEIISSNGLCNYYDIQNHPGLSQIKARNQGNTYAWLDAEEVQEQIYAFTDGSICQVDFFLPGVHCSSCLWLLEHLPRLHPGIQSSRLQYNEKRVKIQFSLAEISLRQVVELLASLGYPPHISLQVSEKNTEPPAAAKTKILKLGLAGFCFGNIMMLSFPEYLGGSNLGHDFETMFRFLALTLALPVVFYCASGFFTTAWQGMRTKILNIDAPIALAITITFSRSLYEILSGTGSGYLDSLSGIVFFMLVGRQVQERAWRSLSFHRDYKAYFPISVQAETPTGLQTRLLRDLKAGDILHIANRELIPADALLLSGAACLDYSFVSGESQPVSVQPGKKLYAGGLQCGPGIRIQVEKTVESSYLTSLWQHSSFARNKATDGDADSEVHVLAKYFTLVLLCLAALTAIYWGLYNPSLIIPAVSAMLIVACPCALLLSATFTNAAVLRALSENGLYLRDAAVIETLAKADTIVMDKTGTLTEGNGLQPAQGSEILPDVYAPNVAALAHQSNHPRSRLLAEHLGLQTPRQLQNLSEVAGAGIEAMVAGEMVCIGSASFTGAHCGGDVHVRIGGKTYSYTEVAKLREGVPALMKTLHETYRCSLLSGDNEKQRAEMAVLFPREGDVRFNASPTGKLTHIETLQQDGRVVVMLGDGLNDAGALQQSDAGITLATDVNNFTPACDAILDAEKLQNLPALLRLCRWGRRAVQMAFGLSLIYNVVGLSFAMQGRLSPMIAAILMPASTITIVILGVGGTWVMGRRLFGGKRDTLES